LTRRRTKIDGDGNGDHSAKIQILILPRHASDRLSIESASRI
jgi:hypothetical protein